MGVSTNAYLFYGIDLGEEPEIGEEALYELANSTYNDQVNLDTHCSGDYPEFFIKIEDGFKSAHRGSPTVIKNIDVNPEWDVMIKEFCDKHDLPYSQPEWILASYWG